MPLEAFNPFGGLTGFDPFGGQSAIGLNPTPSAIDSIGKPTRGLAAFAATLIEEVIRDFEGAAKTAVAGTGSLLEIFGASAPITLDDLEFRDLKGAGMIAAMVAGGFVGHLARGIKALDKIGDAGTVIGRLKRTATIEAASGFAFGLTRPLGEDESRLRATLGDAAFGSAFGAGASAAKSAVNATLGTYRMQLANRNAADLAQEAFKSIEGDKRARELLGIRLFNPETKEFAGIRRNPNGTVRATHYDDQRIRVVEASYPSFEEAIADAHVAGFTQKAGLFRTSDTRNKLIESLSPEVADLLDQGTAGVETLKAAFNTNAYLKGFAISKAGGDAEAELAHLAAEAVTDFVGDLGPFTFESQAMRDEWVKAANIHPSQVKKMSDSDILRAAARNGSLVLKDVENATKIRDLMHDLAYEGAFEGISAARPYYAKDALFARLHTTRFLTRIHPEIEPMTFSAFQRGQTLRVEEDVQRQWMADFLNRFDPRKPHIKEATQVIDTAVKRIFAEAPERTNKDILELAAAEAHTAAVREFGREHATTQAVDEVVTRLRRTFDRMLDVGVVAEDSEIVGFFQGSRMSWRLFDTQAGRVTGWFDSYEDAVKKAADLGITATLEPRSIPFSDAARRAVTPADYTRITRAMQSAIGNVDEDELRRLTAEFAAAEAGGVKPRLVPPDKRRVVGFGDLGEDAAASLESYLLNMERRIAFAGWEKSVQPIVDNALRAKPHLQAWARQFVDDVMGRPRGYERWADDFVRQYFGERVKPHILQRWASFLRSSESILKLGGFTSAFVNSSAWWLNVATKLGPTDAIAGLDVFRSPKILAETVEFMEKNGQPGVVKNFVPLSAEGTAPVGTIKHAWAKKTLKGFGEVGTRIWMAPFNTSEQWMRIATARAVIKREVKKGASDKVAAEIAANVIHETLFDYSVFNRPQVLRSSLGGVIGQFKQFFIEEMQFIASLNKRELAKFTAAMQVAGGTALILNTPFTDLANAASGVFFDKNLEEAAKTLPAKADNAPWARATIFGVPGLFNVDVADYVGLGSFGDFARGPLGPAAADIENLRVFFRDALADHKVTGTVSANTANNFLQRSLPAQIRRTLRAMDIVGTGEVRNPYTQKMVYQPENRFASAAREFLGFPSIELSQDRINDVVVSRVRETYTRVRSDFGREAALAQLRGDSREAQAVLERARAQGINISPASFRYYVREMSRDPAERRQRALPKDLRERYAELWEHTGLTEFELLTGR